MFKKIAVNKNQQLDLSPAKAVAVQSDSVRLMSKNSIKQ